VTDYTAPLLWVVVIAAGAGTLALKLSFVVAMAWIDGVPTRVRWVLGFVPAAVLSALVAPAVAVPADVLAVPGWRRPLAAGVAAVVAWRTEDVAATIGVGMIALYATRAI
jgi:branched-subunit amino acid transport protein